jgi:membrane-bound lytic murein transglycosylase D
MLLLAAGCATAPAPNSPIDSLPPLAAASAVQGPSAAAAPAPAPEREAETFVEPPAPPLPRVRLDPLQDAARAQLWQRLREGFVLPDLDTDLVQKWEQWYARDPDYVQRMAERSGRYLFHIVEEVERRGLPTELALLPFIESAFNPQALSRAAAAGMWQFMPDTGKDFELYQNVFRDDRRDVLASTRAALDYLQQLHGMFGNWPLALAAYNWGQGNVTRAITLNKRAGLATDYLSLSPRMPQETREYVPKLQAVKNIVARPEDFGLSLPTLSDQPYFLSVPIERDIDVALVARLSGMSLEDFQQLNPQLKKPLILAAGTPQVLLPYDNANRFITNRALHQGPLASWTAWVAPRKLSAAQAARQLGISEVELRELNHIPPRMLIKGGSTLVVPRTAKSDDVAEHIADHGRLALAPDLPPLRRVFFKAGRKGESVAAVARRYRVNAGQLAQWNGIGVGGRFKAGQRFVVMLPASKGQPARAGAKLVKSPSGKATAAKVKGQRTVPRTTKAAPPTKPRAARKQPR